ncbi:uncharacterized protein DNG_03643 [Cephalotrichum gorgonifer]|uniref:SET domain-containing protein n=1 Tax=Cephalotrichum gorgonifer TaxID=2041049 RepID=A0AAE8MXD3_9PEZI|nr:uncharacterized protein DNG_03643 [Cephalotrichum gorgonifer]
MPSKSTGSGGGGGDPPGKGFRSQQERYPEDLQQRLRDRFPALAQIPRWDLSDSHREVLKRFMDDYAFRYGQYQQGHVYEWISMANHSCNPNACAVPRNPGTLKALRDIPKDDEVTISYARDKAAFRCRCDTCNARRRTRFSIPMSSTDGSAVGYIRKKVGSLRRSLSSRESSASDYGEDDDDGIDDIGEGGDGKREKGDVGCSQQDGSTTEAPIGYRKRFKEFVKDRKGRVGRWLDPDARGGRG